MSGAWLAAPPRDAGGSLDPRETRARPASSLRSRLLLVLWVALSALKRRVCSPEQLRRQDRTQSETAENTRVTFPAGARNAGSRAFPVSRKRCVLTVIHLLISPDAQWPRNDRSLWKAFPIQAPSQVSDRPNRRSLASPHPGKSRGLSTAQFSTRSCSFCIGKSIFKVTLSSQSQRSFIHRIEKCRSSSSHL